MSGPAVTPTPRAQQPGRRTGLLQRVVGVLSWRISGRVGIPRFHGHPISGWVYTAARWRKPSSISETTRCWVRGSFERRSSCRSSREGGPRFEGFPSRPRRSSIVVSRTSAKRTSSVSGMRRCPFSKDTIRCCVQPTSLASCTCVSPRSFRTALSLAPNFSKKILSSGLTRGKPLGIVASTCISIPSKVSPGSERGD